MPYVDRIVRDELDRGRSPATPGELNYAITMVIKRYLQVKGKTYTTINDIVGALEGAKLEFYRRVVEDYEDGKIEANGDVY